MNYVFSQIKSIKWEWEWGRGCSPLDNFIILNAWMTAPKELAGHINNMIVITKNYYGNIFVSVDDLKRCGEYQ